MPAISSAGADHPPPRPASRSQSRKEVLGPEDAAGAVRADGPGPGEREGSAVHSAIIAAIALLPKSLRPTATLQLKRATAILFALPPGVASKLPWILLTIIISPRLFLLSLLIGLGFLLGYVAAVPTPGEGGAAEAIARIPVREVRLAAFERAGTAMSLSSATCESPTSGQSQSIPVEVDVALSRFLDLFVRDFIVSWYGAMNHSNSDEFPSAVHSSMRHGFIHLGLAAARMSVTSAVVPISQTLINHIREYRRYEESSLPLEIYLARNPASRFQRYLDPSSTHAHLRRLSAHIAVTILPRSDRSSPVVFSFVRELIATTALGGFIDGLSDPDKINLAIVDYCKALMAAKEEAALAGAMVGVGGGGVTNEGSAYSLTDSPAAVAPPVAPPSVVKVARSSSADADSIYIKVVEGRRFPSGGANIYCAVMSGSDVLKTRKVMAEANPAWVEDFQFDWDPSKTKDVDGVIVDVYDSRILRDELIGSVYIPSRQIVPNKFSKCWYTLDTSDSRLGKASQSHTSELLLEIIVVSTQLPADDDDDDKPVSHPPAPLTNPPILTPPALAHPPTTLQHPPKSPFTPTHTQHDLTSPSSPFTPFHPTSLTLLTVLRESEGLVEFMQYMDELNAAAHVQLFLMVDSFRQPITPAVPGPSSVKEEAQGLYETFFATDARHPLRPDEVDTGLVSAAAKRVYGDEEVGREVFDDIQAKVLETLEGFWKGFRASDVFRKYVRDSRRGSRVDVENDAEDEGAERKEGSSRPPLSPPAENGAVLPKGLRITDGSAVATPASTAMTTPPPESVTEVVAADGTAFTVGGLTPGTTLLMTASSSQSVDSSAILSSSFSHMSLNPKLALGSNSDVGSVNGGFTPAGKQPPYGVTSLRTSGVGFEGEGGNGRGNSNYDVTGQLFDRREDRTAVVTAVVRTAQSTVPRSVTEAPPPPPLPLRPTAEVENEVRRRRQEEMEEEDLRLALALQREEEENAWRGRGRSTSGRQSSTQTMVAAKRNSASEVLATEIAGLREQIMVIDEALEAAGSGGG
ncbi:Intermediate filament protein, partial [Irineochytrium annulatum]